MKILIAGASGFIGQPLVESLTGAGHTVQTLSRTARVGQLAWSDESAWRDAVAQADAVINLCGASVAAQRWSEAYRNEILYSRVEPTRKLASARPKVLLNASAVGFYGDHGDTVITEESAPVPDYFTHVCTRWEEAAQEAVRGGGRVVFLRIGQVSARGSGVIESMVNPPQVPFSPWKLGLGGPLGNGRQWVPWVHRDDVLGLFTLALDNPTVSGPLNAVSPNPVTAQHLADALGEILGKPARFSVPLFALKALVGEFAEYLVASQRVVPRKALALGYQFRWPSLTEALADVGSKIAMTEKESRIELLRAEAMDCQGCGLWETRTNVVFGEGNPNSPLVLVGEGPGETEDKTGRPFVGRAGQLLDECLYACGITRKHIFITNVVRCRPTLVGETGRLQNRPPTADEASACVSSWLEPILGTMEPLVILCLGSPSANVVIKRGFKIMSERGQFFESRYARYAIAALHPAYILRQQGVAYDQARDSLIADIEAARKKVVEAKKEPPRTLF